MVLEVFYDAIDAFVDALSTRMACEPALRPAFRNEETFHFFIARDALLRQYDEPLSDRTLDEVANDVLTRAIGRFQGTAEPSEYTRDCEAQVRRYFSGDTTLLTRLRDEVRYVITMELKYPGEIVRYLAMKET
jgi:hypothetical protein